MLYLHNDIGLADIIPRLFCKSLFAWTNGQQSIYFGRTNGLAGNRIEPMRGIRHLFDNTSHDIITYDEYLQPPLDGKTRFLLCEYWFTAK